MSRRGHDRVRKQAKLRCRARISVKRPDGSVRTTTKSVTLRAKSRRTR
jgi:hypothetical protein